MAASFGLRGCRVVTVSFSATGRPAVQSFIWAVCPASGCNTGKHTGKLSADPSDKFGVGDGQQSTANFTANCRKIAIPIGQRDGDFTRHHYILWRGFENISRYSSGQAPLPPKVENPKAAPGPPPRTVQMRRHATLLRPPPPAIGMTE